MSRVHTLKTGAAAQTLPLFTGYAVNLLSTPYVVATIGLSNFGLWAVTGALAQYGALFDLGVSRAVMRFVALYHAQEDHDRERAVIGGSVATIVALGAILVSIPLLFPSALQAVIKADSPELTRHLLLAATAILVTGMVARILGSASFGRGRMVAANIGLAIQTSAIVVGGVLAIIVNPTLENFATGSAAGAGIGLLAVIIAIRLDEKEIRIGLPKRSVMPEIISFGMKGQMMSVSEIVLFQSGKLIAGIVIGPAAAGAYELGSRLAQGARAFGAAASVALTSHLTRAFATSGEDAIRKDYAHLTTRNAAASISVPFLLAATSFSAIPAWLGSTNHDVIMAVLVLSVAFSLNVSTGVATATALALNAPGVLVVASLISIMMMAGLAVPFAFVFGFGGVVAASAIAVGGGSVLGLLLVHRQINVPVNEYFRPIAGPFAVAVVSLIASFPISYFAHAADRGSAILPFIATGAVFSVVYVTLCWRFDYLPKLRN